jgi:hypothetical protein
MREFKMDGMLTCFVQKFVVYLKLLPLNGPKVFINLLQKWRFSSWWLFTIIVGQSAEVVDSKLAIYFFGENK